MFLSVELRRDALMTGVMEAEEGAVAAAQKVGFVVTAKWLAPQCSKF